LPAGEVIIGDAGIADGKATLPGYGCLVLRVA